MRMPKRRRRYTPAVTGPYTFKRFRPVGDQDHWDTPPGLWCGWGGNEIVDKDTPPVPRLFVLLTCPVCGKWAMLPHRVDAQGLVTPSVVCPYPPCPMHLSPVTLEGWSFGEKSGD